VKKVILALSFSSVVTLSANATPKTIVIDMDNISEKAINTIHSENHTKIKSDIDLTHIVTFVKNWREKDSRKKQLVSLYSSVIPQAFKKYPKSKEFHLSTYVNYKNKALNKKQTKHLSQIIINREDLNKIDWASINVENIQTNKYIKKVDFSDL